jgi:hypothetical protein
MRKGVAANAPRVISGLAILAVAVVAGLISYIHIYELSLALHQPRLVARLMPFGVDGLITVGSVVLLQGGLLGWLGIGPGVAISLFANVESGIRYGWLAAVWAGIPAVSFALASFILERWLKGQAAKAGTAQTVAETETVADTESEPEDSPRPERTMTPEQLEEAAREFAADIAAGELPSLREIQTRVHMGRPRAKQIEAHLAKCIAARQLASGRAPTPGRVRAMVRERELAR